MDYDFARDIVTSCCVLEMDEDVGILNWTTSPWGLLTETPHEFNRQPVAGTLSQPPVVLATAPQQVMMSHCNWSTEHRG